MVTFLLLHTWKKGDKGKDPPALSRINFSRDQRENCSLYMNDFVSEWALSKLGVKVRNMKLGFNTGGTLGRVGQ